MRPILHVPEAMLRGGIPVYKTDAVPLTRIVNVVRGEETEQGTLDIHWTEEQDAFFWLIEDKIYVHPDRWDLFMSMMSERVL